jgi:hypothetical protein
MMGAGVRTSNPLALDLPPLIWRRFLGEEVTVRDLADVDERFVRALQSVRLHDCPATWPHLALSGSASVVGCCSALGAFPLSPSSAAGAAAAPLGFARARGSGLGGGIADVDGWEPSAAATGLVWTVRSASGRVVELIPGGAARAVHFEEREAYAEAAIRLRQTEFDAALAAMRRGEFVMTRVC